MVSYQAKEAQMFLEAKEDEQRKNALLKSL